jgi:succinylarginine dihydrolase
VLLDEELIDDLQACVRATYRDRLSPADLRIPAFADECRLAREAVLDILDLEDLA